MGSPVEDPLIDGMTTERAPGGDDRFRELDAAMKRHRFRPDALIEVLHTAQELFGCLGPDLLRHVARGFRLPPSHVYGVATFYHLFTFIPKGGHTCTVCTGTACYVKGSDALLDAAGRLTASQSGSTPPGARISLDTARCLGACGLAPIVVFDGQVVGQISPEELTDRVKGWIDHGS
ncbi:bidirectional hydrogenase complex protein HoxE [Tautonia sp. JC769]|uniref:bidirectional hydrogenase complex protein HoxE n=1 Tax=Tautonia sp. JC769 TaxID=3232135 RepID=UPI003458AA4D